MKSEYTKGEWRAVKSPTGDWVITTEDELICREVRHYNVPLIAQAPKLYEACKAQHQAIDILFAMLIERDKAFFPSKSGKPWGACLLGNQAIAPVEDK